MYNSHINPIIKSKNQDKFLNLVYGAFDVGPSKRTEATERKTVCFVAQRAKELSTKTNTGN